jgi:dTDP-4-amino-4,6-dideoxygalactose transaminase
MPGRAVCSASPATLLVPTLAQTDPIEQLPRTESLAGRLLRLPLFSDLADADQERVIAALMEVVTLL